MASRSGDRVEGVFAFEQIDATLPLLPLAARRALDVAGLKLSLRAWQGLALSTRRRLVELGRLPHVDPEQVHAALEGAAPAPTSLEPDDEQRLAAAPAQLDVDPAAWASFDPLRRYALAHLAAGSKSGSLAAALDELVPPRLTHLRQTGEAHMVDVGDKPVTHRRAVAGATVRMSPETARLVADASGPKGDVLATARIAGIMAAKRTSELIPLCHGIAVSSVTVDLRVDPDRGQIAIEATAQAHDRTGVEMEAMVGASIAALTVYDMVKAVERGVSVEQVVLLEKSGGRSGHYRRGDG